MQLSIPRRNAFYVAGMFYILLNAKILVILSRLRDLMRFLTDDFVVEGYSKVALHIFIANPFGYFGNSDGIQLDDGKGLGLLVIVWWLANTTLLILGFSWHVFFVMIIVIFWGMGFGSIRMILEFCRVAAERLEFVDRELYLRITENNKKRKRYLLISNVVGCSFAIAMRDYMRPM